MTGASRGLGKAIASRLAGEGATVALTARTMDADPKYIGLIVETAFALCTAEPTKLTGRVVHTQPFLREIGRLA